MTTQMLLSIDTEHTATSILRNRSQLTLPKEAVKALKLAEGDIIEVAITDNGSLLLTPKTLISKAELEELRAEIKAISEHPEKFKSYNKDNAGSMIDDIMAEED